MPEDSVMQIRIGDNLVGIVGLKQVMEKMAGAYPSQSDDEIGAEMIRHLSGMNYIPRRAGYIYAHAFIREFRRYLGQPIDEQPVTGLRIAVLGPGCARCNRMEMDVREVLTEMKLPAELLHVTAPLDIAKYGVMGVPALIINDRVACVGQTPHTNEIKAWLQAAVSTNRKE